MPKRRQPRESAAQDGRSERPAMGHGQPLAGASYSRRSETAATVVRDRRPKPRQANSSLITLPELAIFIGRPFLAVKVVSSEIPRALSTLAITSCDV